MSETTGLVRLRHDGMLPAHPLFVPGLGAPCCILCFGHFIVVGAKILVGAFMS